MLFDVAFVCTGNRFRSAIAAAAFGAAVNGLPVRTSSYGTLDLGPAEPLPEAIVEANALGLDLSSHVATTLAGADLSDASLVVGFELEHVVTAIDVSGAEVERVFILPELIELFERIGVVSRPDPVEQAVENVARAHASRVAEPRRRAVVEIDDPIGLAPALQHEIAVAVCRHASDLAGKLFARAS